MPNKYSPWMRFKVWVNGRVLLSEQLSMSTGNPVTIRIYLAKCRKHGYFEDSLHGYSKYMNCPNCIRQEAKL